MLNARAIAKQILPILIIFFLSCSGFGLLGAHAYGYPGEIFFGLGCFSPPSPETAGRSSRKN
jgi:hypothetical protein